MRVIASGCSVCEPQVVPQGEREGEHHFAVRLPLSLALEVPLEDGSSSWARANVEVLIDGETVRDVTEAWVGQPGRVIRLAREEEVHPCPNHLPFMDRSFFAELVEYDSVEVNLTLERDSSYDAQDDGARDGHPGAGSGGAGTVSS